MVYCKCGWSTPVREIKELNSMELTLEKELVARVFLHKVAIVKSAIANNYIKEEVKRGGIMLSQPCLEQNALDYADNVVQGILSVGSLNEAYDKAWEVVSTRMPDNFSIM